MPLVTDDFVTMMSRFTLSIIMHKYLQNFKMLLSKAHLLKFYLRGINIL